MRGFGGKISARQRRWLEALAVSSLILVADIYVVSSGILQTTDLSLWKDYATALGPPAFRVVEALTLVGVVHESDRIVTICSVLMTIGFAGLFVIRRLPFVGAMLVVAVSGTAAVAEVLKVVVDRNGPSLTAWTAGGHTFPSGTAAVAVAFFGMLAYVAYHRLKRARAWAVGVCMLVVLGLLASSLTYHYPTEVLGGVATGIAWLSLLQIVFWESLRRELFFRELREESIC